MQHGVRPSSLVPPCFAVVRSEIDGDRAIVTVRSSASSGACPSCGGRSERVQSHYARRASDLPIAGRRVELEVLVRRFWCDAVLCGRRIFAERFRRAPEQGHQHEITGVDTPVRVDGIAQ